MRLRTANHHRRRAHRRAVLKAAFDFDMGQIAKCERSGNWKRRRNSGFVRRSNKRSKALTRWLLIGLTPPSRPWLRLGA